MVVLPDPVGPTTAIILPFGAEMETSFKIGLPST